MPHSFNQIFTSLESKFRETGDFNYVLLAIGENPDDPPAWALEACVGFSDEQRLAVESFEDRRRGGPKRKHNREDGILLLQVARLVDEGASKTSAIQQVTGEDVDGPTFKRLMRAWNKNSRYRRIFLPGKPRPETNKWLDYIAKEKHERFLKRVTDQAWKEIEEDNLDVEIDEEEERRRLASARAFAAAPSDSPADLLDGPRLLLAPAPSFEVFVKHVKRTILENLAAEDQDAEDPESTDSVPSGT